MSALQPPATPSPTTDFSWYGTDYTVSTDSPTHLSSNSVGCDSTTTLHLTIRYSTASSVEETIVENNLPYTFNGVTFTDSSDFTTVTIPNAVGCDSVISYTLHVDWNTGSRLDSNICFNQLPVSWNNVSFDTTSANVTMMRTVVIPSSSGSDSTIIMRLHVRPIYNDTIPYSICTPSATTSSIPSRTPPTTAPTQDSTLISSTPPPTTATPSASSVSMSALQPLETPSPTTATSSPGTAPTTQSPPTPRPTSPPTALAATPSPPSTSPYATLPLVQRPTPSSRTNFPTHTTVPPSPTASAISV